MYLDDGKTELTSSVSFRVISRQRPFREHENVAFRVTPRVHGCHDCGQVWAMCMCVYCNMFIYQERFVISAYSFSWVMEPPAGTKGKGKSKIDEIKGLLKGKGKDPVATLKGLVKGKGVKGVGKDGVKGESPSATTPATTPAASPSPSPTAPVPPNVPKDVDPPKNET